ncbi:MAG: hypothetical protein COB36_10415 [Alphaproteobacteria bacterium]|nr:MAG: hypothetical protein COB36_10415 [Alphaproteobacteria bacterium]
MLSGRYAVFTSYKMMENIKITTGSYFDGEKYHNDGPYHIVINDGVISSIERKNYQINVAFLMPGLVEAHCHLFLDGGELELSKRSAYLKASQEEMLSVGHKNIQQSIGAGITLIRDAGDKYGVNHMLRNDAQGVVIRSPGLALRSPKRYGSFMAREVESEDDIRAALSKNAVMSDDIKIILTGIIDFEAGAVKGHPQFDLEALKLIVQLSHEKGLKTYAHCSGEEGLTLALAAGVDSIEHGFFMSRNILEQMAEKQVAWVPTFSPVHFQWQQPEMLGWDDTTVGNLRRILDEHLLRVAMAADIGVPLVAGSDAGSYGVNHGKALIDELFHFAEAGVNIAEILRSATSRPRHMWGMKSADIKVGVCADFVAFGGSPFDDMASLRKAVASYRNGSFMLPFEGEL